MNEQVAYALMNAELTRLRALPYSQLVSAIAKPDTFDRVGEDGKRYQLEVETIWDGKKGENVRVIVTADDGGIRALKPLTGDFIMRPDGSFVESFAVLTNSR